MDYGDDEDDVSVDGTRKAEIYGIDEDDVSVDGTRKAEIVRKVGIC